MAPKLSNNGGINAAERQIIDNQYLEPFRGGRRTVVGLALAVKFYGKGLVDWKAVGE